MKFPSYNLFMFLFVTFYSTDPLTVFLFNYVKDHFEVVGFLELCYFENYRLTWVYFCTQEDKASAT